MLSGVMRVLIPIALCAFFVGEGLLAGIVFTNITPYKPLPPEQILGTQKKCQELRCIVWSVRQKLNPDSPLASVLRTANRLSPMDRAAKIYLDNHHSVATTEQIMQYESILHTAEFLALVDPDALIAEYANPNREELSQILRWNHTDRRYEVAAKNIFTFDNKLPSPPTDQSRRLENILQRAAKYRQAVDMWGRQFRLKTDLIYAIMYTESTFNPRLISSREAHGLMQVVPSTAGNEVSEWLGEKRPPNGNDLLDPSTNIKYGTGYFRLLQQRYFDSIHDSLSREYCAIAAYNSGSAPVLRVFAPTRQEAFEVINSLNADEVLNALLDRLPIKETRSYIRKVLHARQYFTTLSNEPQSHRVAMRTILEKQP